MENRLEPLDALADFFEHNQQTGVELNFFRALAKGTAKDAKGNIVVPTGKRVQKFLDKYAQGRYTLRTYFTKNEAPDTT